MSADRLAEKIRIALDGGLPLLHREDRMARRREAEEAIDALVEIAKAAREVSRIEATGVLPDFMPLAQALAKLDSGGGAK